MELRVTGKSVLDEGGDISGASVPVTGNWAGHKISIRQEKVDSAC
jgi:hypothetical protein